MNTKHWLIDICWDKSLEYLTNNSPEIMEVFKSLWTLEDSVFQEYSSLYLNSLVAVEDETIVELRTKLEKHQMETNALLEAAEGLEKDLTTSHQTIEKLRSEHWTEIEEMRAQMEEMQEENKMLLDQIVKRTKDWVDKMSPVVQLAWASDDGKPETNRFTTESGLGLPATHFMTLASAKTEMIGKTKVW